MSESELSECTREVMQLMSSVLLDMEKMGRGNIRAAQRARVGTINLAKLTKRFRALSVECHDEIKSNRVLVQLSKHVPVKRLSGEAARQKKIDAKIAKSVIRQKKIDAKSVIIEAKREAKRNLQIVKNRKRIHQLSAMLAKLQEGL